MLALFIAPAIALMLICFAFFISWLRGLLHFMTDQSADERRLRRSDAWHTPGIIGAPGDSFSERGIAPEHIAERF